MTSTPPSTAPAEPTLASLAGGVDSPYAWFRLMVCLLLMTIGNGGMWTVKEIRDRDIIAKKKGRDDVSYLAVDSIDGMGTNYAMVPNPFWFWNGKANDLHLPEKMQRSHYHEFDYGYAITCHKSQGSQWDKVLVYDESQIFGRAGEEDIPDRWLYTAATRAAEALIIVVGD